MTLAPKGDEDVVVNTDTSTITIGRDDVQIEKHGIGGLWQGGLRAQRRIAYEQITAIGWREAGLFTEGYMQIVYAGSDNRDAFHDPAAVVFKKRNQAKVAAAKQEIERRVHGWRERRHAPAVSGAEEIARLADLRDKGILTEDEFQAKKRQLLGL